VQGEVVGRASADPSTRSTTTPWPEDLQGATDLRLREVLVDIRHRNHRICMPDGEATTCA